PPFLSLPPPQPASTLFPYTTLFRSREKIDRGVDRHGIDAGVEVGVAGLAGNRSIGGGKDSAGVALRALRTSEEGRPSRDLRRRRDRKSTRLNSSHDQISYAVFCLKK